MRLSLIVSVVSVMALAACAEAPKAPATPVQANQAAAPAATSSDATADTTQAKPRKKYMNTGSRLPSESVDPSVGGPPAGGLNNATSNASGGGPH